MDIEHYFTETGNGEPLILLHGNGEDCGYFQGQIEEFSNLYHVYAIVVVSLRREMVISFRPGVVNSTRP